MYKKVYDESKGIFIYVDSWSGFPASPNPQGFPVEYNGTLNGSGFFDTLTETLAKIVPKVGKKALETAGKQALESGTKKIGTEVGNLAADKIISTFKKKEPTQPVGNLIVKELKKHNNNNNKQNTDDDIDMRINKLLSGSGRRNKINKLIGGK